MAEYTLQVPDSGRADKTDSKRIQAVDVMRGLTIILMIIVNNAGGDFSYVQFQHSDWNGLTLCDLVFPFFLFIMGISTYLSLSRYKFQPSRQLIRKILSRTIAILLICWALHWLDNVCAGKPLTDFGHLRLTGVLTRIAVCYCIVSFMAIYMSRRQMIISAIILLVVYSVLLLFGNGYNNDSTNINAIVDRYIFGESHIYVKRPIDPEGLLATMSAVAHTIIGFLCGAIIKHKVELKVKLKKLCSIGLAGIFIGLMVNIILPINKRIWSPSYVLVTCGIAAILLALLCYLIDAKGYLGYFRCCVWFGVNSLFLYVLAEVIGILSNISGFRSGLYQFYNSLIPDAEFASLLYSISIAVICCIAAYEMYKKNIRIKL